MDVQEQQIHSRDSKVSETLGANIICLIIAYTGLLLRLLSRRLARAKLGMDDGLMILALILYTFTAIDGFVCISLGAGRHETFASNKPGFAKASFAFIILYRPTIALVKFSVIFLYRRIFPQTGFRTLLTWYGIFVLIYTVAFFLLDIFHCHPVGRAWDHPDTSSCLNMDTIWIVGGALNAVTDIAALCLPMPLLWKLHVTKEKRIQLMGVFVLGGFVCVVSIIRVIELSGIQNSQDETWEYATTIIWSTVEVGVGIFCASLPVMRPILHQFVLCVPTMEGKSNSASSKMFHKPTQATNFRMRSYRNSERLGDEYTGTFQGARSQSATELGNSDSIARDAHLESGHGHGTISVTTDIEQEIKDIPNTSM